MGAAGGGRYEKKVKDYNFGSLIRTDARQEYSETNTIFVTRIQVRKLCSHLTCPSASPPVPHTACV